MKLNVRERILLLNILPQETNFVTLRIIRNLKENLSFKENELKEYEIKIEGEKVFWNLEKDNEAEIEIGEKATDIIVEALKKLDKENKLTMDFVSLYEKFIER